jgi:mono/diheme cytochrome c family protein
MRWKTLVPVLGALALSACARLQQSAPPAQPPAPAAAPAAAGPAATPAPAPAEPAATAAPISDDARNLFKTRCAICHGETGKGDGLGAASLNPKPRNYSDAAWQASVTDETLKKVIVEGGPAIGLSPLMVHNPDLASRPEMVDDLVRIIRSFKG